MSKTYIPPMQKLQESDEELQYQMYGDAYYQKLNEEATQENMALAESFKKDYYTHLATFMHEQVPSVIDVTTPKSKLQPGGPTVYSKYEAKKKRKAYKEAAEKGKTINISMSAFANSKYMTSILEEKVDKCEEGVKTQRQLYEKCRTGVFNDFEKLDPVLRDTLAIEYTREKLVSLYRTCRDLKKIVDAVDGSMGHEGLAHPLLRLGISLGMRGQVNYDGISAEDCKKLDDLFNQRIMRNTLINVMTKEEGDELVNGNLMTREQLEEAKTRDINSKKYIMKSLLIAQLGKMKKVTGDDKAETRWDASVASAFAHCSRVMYTLPSELVLKGRSDDELKNFRRRYIGEHGGIEPGTGFEVRTSATHRASAGTKKSKAKEQKMRLGWYWDQSGINVAVGGLGKKGIGGRPLLNDGSCGHLYRYYRPGDYGEYGVMMLGFESDAYKKKNQLGHTHGFGNGEYCSSFGGQRVDEIGNKYGGRTVDATGVDLNFADILFNIIDGMFNHINEDGQMEKITELADLLSGQRLEDNTELQVKLIKLLFPDESVPEQSARLTKLNQGWR